VSNEFVNQVVVITGGAKGIGACVAQAFIARGATVIFSDVDEQAGKEREKLLNQNAGAAEARFIHADLSQTKEVERFCHAILHDFASINVLVNNAGIFSTSPIIKRSIQDWDAVMSVNLRSAFICTKLLTPALIGAKGNVINLASTRALMSEADTEPYSASKGAMVALTHSLAISLGKFAVRANCISPGWIETSEWQLPARKAKLRAIDHEQHPVGRVGKPEDIAQACLFLASEVSAGFITGHNLVVDGGMTKKMIYVE